MTTPAEIFLLDQLDQKIMDRREDVGQRMLNGVASWEAYLKAVGEAKALEQMRADIEAVKIDLIENNGKW